MADMYTEFVGPQGRKSILASHRNDDVGSSLYSAGQTGGWQIQR